MVSVDAQHTAACIKIGKRAARRCDG
jgi:hypothetical protein